MLNFLIRIASGLTILAAIGVTVVGALYGGGIASREDPALGYVVGGAVGFCVAAIVFGVIAAIFDMQHSLRILAGTARRSGLRIDPPSQ